MKKRNILIILAIIVIIFIVGIVALSYGEVITTEENIDLGSITNSTISFANTSSDKEIKYTAEITVDMAHCNNTTEAKALLKNITKEDSSFEGGSFTVRLANGSQVLKFNKSDIKLISIDENQLVIQLSGTTNSVSKDFNLTNPSISFLELTFKESKTFETHWIYLKT